MLYTKLDELKTGGYCFGNRVYIRDNLRILVNQDLYVTHANKIGLDVAPSAIVILYEGRNITSNLIEELMEQKVIIKSEANEIIFVNKVDERDWCLSDLKETDRVSLELRQGIDDLEIILKKCLKKCDSFKDDVDAIKVVDKAYDWHWEWRNEKYFCVFNGAPKYNRNITVSLVEKLQELNLLYNDGGKYTVLTDERVSVGLEYQIGNFIQNVLFFFCPLILISGILFLFFNKIIAILALIGGTIYFIIQRRSLDFTKTKQDKMEYIESIVIYIAKWSAVVVACTPIAVLFLGILGLAVPIGLVIFAIRKYKKLFNRKSRA